MDLNSAKRGLEARRVLRDGVLSEQRGIVAMCAAAIREVHVGNRAKAKSGLKKVEKKIAALERRLSKDPLLRDRLLGICYQEYVELAVLVSVLECNNLPKLDVPAEHYVLGVLDAIGELKREVMTLLLNGELTKALKLYGTMEKVYYSMEGYSFPNSIAPGMKAKQDAMKRVLEGLYATLVEAQMRMKAD